MIFEHTNGKKYDIIEVGKAKDMRGTYGDFIVDTRVFDISEIPDNRHSLWRATCSCGNVEIKNLKHYKKLKNYNVLIALLLIKNIKMIYMIKMVK